MTEIKFDLKETSVPVTLDHPSGPVQYRLVEMRASQRDAYMDQLMSRVRPGVDGKPSTVSKFDRLQSNLIVKCLQRVDGKSVTEDEVQEWPASVVAGLFKAAQDLNGLNQAEKVDAPKNA